MGGGRFPPPEALKTWPKANYINPETHGWEVPIICITLYTLALIVVSLRLYARLVLLKSASIDDYLIIASMVPLLGLCISLCLASKVYKFDKHVWDIPWRELKYSRMIVLPILLTYNVSAGLTKLSVLFFYRRLSEGAVTPILRRIAHSCIVFVALFTVVFTFIPLVECRPLNAFWNQVDPIWYKKNKNNYKCLDEKTLLLIHATISVIQDFIACSLPITIFWKLQLPMKQKLLLAVFPMD